MQQPADDSDALAEGDDDASPDVETIYRDNSDAMYRYARRCADGDEELAADLVQQVILDMVKRKPRNVVNWEAYLIRALRYKILDHWKSAAHRAEMLRLEVDEPEYGPQGGERTLTDLEEDVLEELERQEKAKVVREAWAELRSVDREAAYAFEQNKLVERSSSEIGKELGVSDSRVRQLVKRARERLTAILTEKGMSL